jgi:AcrR family transcriptional regulator
MIFFIMSEKKKKQTRARAPEKKAEQFEKILDVGREMFVKFGSHGFSMRALAKELNMTQPNLYNYVNSKRELWIAIRKKYFKDLNEVISDIVKNHRGPYIELFMRLSEGFLEFSSVDHIRFQMMFLIPAPRSKKVGPLEAGYEPENLVKRILDLIIKAVKSLGVEVDKSTTNILYLLFATLLGAVLTEGFLKIHSKIGEPIAGDFYDLPPKEYRDFVLNEIRGRLERTPLIEELENKEKT